MRTPQKRRQPGLTGHEQLFDFIWPGSVWGRPHFVRLTVAALGAARVAAFVKVTTEGVSRKFQPIDYGLASSAAPPQGCAP